MIAYVKKYESNRGGNESKCDATRIVDRIPGNRINRRGTRAQSDNRNENLVDLSTVARRKRRKRNKRIIIFYPNFTWILREFYPRDAINFYFRNVTSATDHHLRSPLSLSLSLSTSPGILSLFLSLAHSLTHSLTHSLFDSLSFFPFALLDASRSSSLSVYIPSSFIVHRSEGTRKSRFRRVRNVSSVPNSR